MESDGGRRRVHGGLRPARLGKSVLVRLLTRLEQPDAEHILLRGVDITNFAPGAQPEATCRSPLRSTHFSVRDNIAYPLDLAHVPKSERNQEVERVAELLDIADLLDRRPDPVERRPETASPSRAGWSSAPMSTCTDDPLVGLDFKLPERLIDDLKRTQEMLQRHLRLHDVGCGGVHDAGHEDCRVGRGRIVECAPPVQLYQQPQRQHALRGLPQANLLPATLAQDERGQLGQHALLQFAWQPDADGALDGGAAVTVGLRPEHIQIGRGAPAGHRSAGGKKSAPARGLGQRGDRLPGPQRAAVDHGAAQRRSVPVARRHRPARCPSASTLRRSSSSPTIAGWEAASPQPDTGLTRSGFPRTCKRIVTWQIFG
ncbi:MAG: hypothetical protein R2838_10800 [Caldilineaceae bacterium]